jgi:hypothetical protein
MEGVRNRLLICAGIAAGVLIASVLSVITSGSGNASLTRWMTYLSRNLSFCSALLNFVLWSALIRRRQRDPQLLLVSAGMGLDTTGKAIGHSLRWISRSAVPIGNVLIVITHLLALTLWWYSFARMRPRNPGETHSRRSAEAENASVQLS